MRLAAPVTKGFFFPLCASSLDDPASPGTISIYKKKISSGTQGIKIHIRFHTWLKGRNHVINT